MDTGREIKSSEIEKMPDLNQELDPETKPIVEVKDFVQPEALYEQLLRSICKYHPSADVSMVEKAYRSPAKRIKTSTGSPGNPISSIRCMWRLSWRNWRWIRRRSWQGFCMTW